MKRARHTPSRLTVARMRRGLKGWQVADALEMRRERWNDLEKGRATATRVEIDKVAALLRFPAPFFYRPHIELPQI